MHYKHGEMHAGAIRVALSKKPTKGSQVLKELKFRLLEATQLVHAEALVQVPQL